MPIVNFQDRLWEKPNPNRVHFKRLAWVHYGHVDLEKVRVYKYQLAHGIRGGEEQLLTSFHPGPSICLGLRA